MSDRTFRAHFADGTRRDVEASTPDAVRERFKDAGVHLLKVKLVREKRRAS